MPDSASPKSRMLRAQARIGHAKKLLAPPGPQAGQGYLSSKATLLAGAGLAAGIAALFVVATQQPAFSQAPVNATVMPKQTTLEFENACRAAGHQIFMAGKKPARKIHPVNNVVTLRPGPHGDRYCVG